MTPAPLAYAPAPARVEQRAPSTLTPVSGGMSRTLDSMLWLSVLFAAFNGAVIWTLPTLIHYLMGGTPWD